SLGKQSAWFLERMGLYDPDELSEQGLFPGKPGQRRLLLGLVRIDRLQRLFGKLFDEREFLSPYGLRSISAFHRDHPYEQGVEGQPPLQRGLPRRQRRRPGRRAPDRMDRPGGRPDPAPARGGGALHRGFHAPARRADGRLRALAVEALPGSAFPLGATPADG